jgi:hypothetical protein
MSETVAMEDRLRRAATTASNDDASLPMTEKRERHVERVDAMLAGADELSRLRAQNEQMAEALRECGADWSSSPGTVMGAAAELGREFKRRMQIAADALSSARAASAIAMCDCGKEAQLAWMQRHKELETLWAAIVANTQGDLFWIGEILLSELAKETGYNGPRGRGTTPASTETRGCKS